jgi:large exoprotein involved in heme utilization and adhesion
LSVNASNQVQVIGTSANGQSVSGLFSQADPGASGKAGDLTINTNTLLVRDGAVVSVRSFRGQAGNMIIQAKSLLLDQGRLFAETAKSDAQGGANITLFGLDLLRMDNESLMSANALDQANGGNITIDSTFIVATPPTGSKGSDITANAVRGNGGRVNITTQGLFGIELRPQPTSKNDITVSSEFGLTGEFQLYSPDVDPSRGLTNLPTAVVDVSNQIAQTCPSGGRKVAKNQFIVTGRGGLPANPTDTLSSDTVWTDLRNPSVVSSHPSEEPVTPKAVTPQAPIMEANGWVINDKGEVVLMAVTPTVTLYSRGWTQSQCHVSQTSRE